MTCLCLIVLMAISILEPSAAPDAPILMVLAVAIACFVFDSLIFGKLDKIRRAVEMVGRKIDDA